MKQYLAILLAALAAVAPGAAPNANAAAISFGFGAQINSVADFYSPLRPYGTWVNAGPYGRCWRPAQVPVGWRPYSDGSWVWTDAGWYWQSDEPWGWATCHYGSWYDDPNLGWVWIPGTEWAPAWVSWRYSNDYIGWAPIGPNLAVAAPSFFVFVGVNRFRSGFRPDDLIVNNTRIIKQTRSVRNFQRQTVNVNGRQRTIYANKGPGVAPIERATGQRVAPRPVAEVARQTRAPENLPGNQNQQPSRPGQRPGGEATPSATGREQSRTYPQQPEQARPQGQNQPEQKPAERPGQQPQAVPPTGSEQLNNNQRPEQSPAQRPQGEQRPQTTPQEQTPSKPSQPPRVTPETPTTPSQPPAEKPLPPTGREQQPAPQTPTERPLPPTGMNSSLRNNRRKGLCHRPAVNSRYLLLRSRPQKSLCHRRGANSGLRSSLKHRHHSRPVKNLYRRPVASRPGVPHNQLRRHRQHRLHHRVSRQRRKSTRSSTNRRNHPNLNLIRIGTGAGNKGPTHLTRKIKKDTRIACLFCLVVKRSLP